MDPTQVPSHSPIKISNHRQSPKPSGRGSISSAEQLFGSREVGLVDVEVRARLVYDAFQLEGIAGSDSGCGCGLGKEELSAYARRLAGRVWSAKVFARKPL